MVLETNKIKILLPYIGSLMILCGFLKLNIYYSHFSIKISDYIEITEVLTLFLTDAIKYSSIIFGVYVFTFITDTNEEQRENELRKDDILKTDNFFQRLKKFISYKLGVIILTILCTIGILIANYLNKDNLFFFIMVNFMLIALIIFTYILFEFRRKYKISYGKELNSTYYNLILIFALFFIYLIQSASLDIKKTEDENSISVAFKYSEKIIHTDYNNKYIGQTKNYLFLYNKKLKKASVYPRQSISDFEIQKTTANN